MPHDPQIHEADTLLFNHSITFNTVSTEEFFFGFLSTLAMVWEIYTGGILCDHFRALTMDRGGLCVVTG